MGEVLKNLRQIAGSYETVVTTDPYAFDPNEPLTVRGDSVLDVVTPGVVMAEGRPVKEEQDFVMAVLGYVSNSPDTAFEDVMMAAERFAIAAGITDEQRVKLGGIDPGQAYEDLIARCD